MKINPNKVPLQPNLRFFLYSIFILSLVLLSTQPLLGQTTLPDFQKKLNKAKNQNSKKQEAKYFILIGDYYVKHGEINKGQRYYRRSYRRNRNNEFPSLGVQLNRQFARSYDKEEKYDRAKDSYQLAIEIAIEKNLNKEVQDIQKEFNSFKKKVDKIQQNKEKLEKLNELSDEEALKVIEKDNKEVSDEFLEEIEKLNEENQIKEFKIRYKENEIDKKELKISLLDQRNQLKNAEIARNKAEIEQQNAKIAIKEAQSKKQRAIIGFSIAGIAVLLIIVVLSIWYYKKQKSLNLQLSNQNLIIEQKNKEMTDSISYAQKIQEAILLSSNQNKDLFPQHFIFNQPKEIVSGDFYWVYKTDSGKIIWTVVDCTGHGVPGAFMSMIGNQLLN